MCIRDSCRNCVVTSFYHGEKNHYGFFTQVSNLILQSTNKKICEKLHIDNYIALGKSINSEVYEKGQSEYGYYKILCREGFINIIPYDSTEKEIQQYVEYLKGTEIRN